MKTVRQESVDLFGSSLSSEEVLPDGVREVVQDILRKYAAYSDERLKTRVYLSKPMRRILREEKASGRGLFNCPITFDEPTAALSP